MDSAGLIDNPPPPAWWDARFEPFPVEPMTRTELPCGCHLRRGDFEAVLCVSHLADLNRRPGG